MNLEEVLKLADQIVFDKTGQHLDDLQEAILKGTLQREKYKQIAKNFDSSESNVRQVGSELWRILSEGIGEDVSKSNLKSAMERLQVSIYSNVAQEESVQINSINVCGESTHALGIPNSNNEKRTNINQPQTLHQDLSEMPELGAFYDRLTELETLANWIDQRCRLIALTGSSGIGKTTLAIQLVQQIKDEFEYVLWCSLESSPTLVELQDKLIEFFSQPENTSNQKLPIIKYLQKYRCLIFLDDVHNLFSSGELAGKYKPGYEEYRSFFKQIEKLSHQSCFVLIGWEQPREIPHIKNQNSSIQTLQITGLDIAAGRKILRDYNLAEIDNLDALVRCYRGNPLYLKSVASLIQELGGSVTGLLQNDAILLPEDLKDVLQQQFNRLTILEQQILSLLARENTAINLVKLIEMTQNLPSDLLNALQSLSRRCLIEQQGSFYTLSPAIKQYALLKNDSSNTQLLN